MVRVEREEDLYYLYLLVDPGDVLRAWTTREYRPEGARRSERIRVRLGVRVEALEFHRFRRSLRVRGVIVEAPEDLEGVRGRHHSIDVQVGAEVVVVKPPDYPRRLVDEVVELAKRSSARALLVSIDVDEAAFAWVDALGVEVVATVPRRAVGDEAPIRRFLEAVAARVRAMGRHRLVVAGPGSLLDEARRVFGDAEYVRLGSGGLAGVYEFQRTAMDVLARLGLAEASAQVARLMELLAKSPGRVALGFEAVERAVEVGAAEAVLVVDEVFKERAAEFKRVARAVYDTGARLVFIPETSDAANVLRGVGGVAALLRYELE